jgi:hypothetical protein
VPMSQLVIAEIFGWIKESDSEEAHVSNGWALITVLSEGMPPYLCVFRSSCSCFTPG